MSLITQESMRVRIGLQPNDQSRDADIDVAAEVTMSIIEDWCYRKFPFKSDQEETFTHVNGGTISLIRYPVWEIHTLQTDGSDIQGFHIESKTGLIHFDGGHVHSHEIKVNYAGGYPLKDYWDPLSHDFNVEFMPAALQMATMLLFDNVWSRMENTGGGISGNVESVTLTQVGTVRFATGDAAQSSGGLLTNEIMNLLEPYRRAYN